MTVVQGILRMVIPFFLGAALFSLYYVICLVLSPLFGIPLEMTFEDWVVGSVICLALFGPLILLIKVVK